MSATLKLFEWESDTKPRKIEELVVSGLGEGKYWSLGVGRDGLEVFAFLRLVESDEIEYEVTNHNSDVIIYEYQTPIDKTAGKIPYITIEHAYGKRRIIGERNETL